MPKLNTDKMSELFKLPVIDAKQKVGIEKQKQI